MKFAKLGIAPAGTSTCDDDIYSLKDFKGEEFKNDDFILRVVDEEGWCDWVILDDVGEGYILYAYGDGPGCRNGHSLREPRHTYFGDGGYIFYVQPKYLAWCFEILKKWFDYDR